ncbi:MAG: DUF502 domain-containing protein [Verrucomicrobiae bacterium]|nr:DUF502 domain-containing protein [Verrucomicrobiae bacterium]MDW8311065.1 DUF502 domain-containing protein [Verrucomicrobiales bacterium]
MKKRVWARFRACFVAGVAVLLPVIITLAIVKWLFGTVASLTDTLLFFLPQDLTHADGGRGPMHWYWSVFALALAVALVALVGLMARYYIGKRFIAWLDATMLRLPLLNKIYGTVKQVNEAFSSTKKTAFKTVVLVEFPREGLYSLGFITGEQHEEVQARTRERVVSVFVPTTPNPTTGFLILVPEDKVTKLDMSVADGIKFVISLGSISPEFSTGTTKEQLLKTLEAARH